MPNTPPNLLASGTIRPCRFVKISGAFQCAEADANEDVIGVSMEGTNTAPLSDLVTSDNAAVSGDSLRIFGNGDTCLLQIGDTVTYGQRLKSDADGKGVPVATTGTTIQYYGARALQSGSASEKIWVQIEIGVIRPALA